MPKLNDLQVFTCNGFSVDGDEKKHGGVFLAVLASRTCGGFPVQ